MSYCKNGFRYDLPIFLINDPSSFIEAEQAQTFPEKVVEVDETVTRSR